MHLVNRAPDDGERTSEGDFVPELLAGRGVDTQTVQGARDDRRRELLVVEDGPSGAAHGREEERDRAETEEVGARDV